MRSTRVACCSFKSHSWSKSSSCPLTISCILPLNSARHAAQVPNVTYFTDTEGNYEYFQRSVEESEGLRLIRVDSDGVLDLDLPRALAKGRSSFLTFLRETR